jgi:hypothetical protein
MMGEDSSADAFIAFLNLMAGSDLEIAIAKKAEGTLQEAVETTINAAETPEGKPWAVTRRGGRRAYPTASSHLSTKSYGNLVKMTLEGTAAYGHFGRTGKQVARPMLPDAGAGMPTEVAEALDKAAGQVFEENWGKV